MGKKTEISSHKKVDILVLPVYMCEGCAYELEEAQRIKKANPSLDVVMIVMSNGCIAIRVKDRRKVLIR